MNSFARGFTLIELMIVVAIISILAAVAIPSYQTYIAKAQVDESLEILSGLKIDFTSAYGEFGSCPINGDNGFGSPTFYAGHYIQQVDFSGPLGSMPTSTCSITFTFKNDGVVSGLAGKKVIIAMTASSSNTVSQWEIRQSVTQGDVPVEFLPTPMR